MSNATAAEPGGASETLVELLDEIQDAALRRQVFTHASWIEDRADSYERLAFIGDVVLSLAISSDLYPRLVGYGAGRLTKVRAQAVSGSACASVAEEIGLPERLRTHAEGVDEATVAALLGSERVLASICEAVIGATYLSFGFDRVAPTVVRAFKEQVDEALHRSVDFKSVLQERLARRAQVVAYRIEAEHGPPHARHFVAVAHVEDEEIGRGEGRTKKSAEQAAAARALDAWGED
jgi:ribonuclease-3